MIKSIIFDIGRVLITWEPKLDGIYNAETAEAVEAAIWDSGYWEQMDLGILEDETLLSMMLEYAPAYQEQILHVYNNLHLISEIYDYAIPWVQSLKDAGYNVYYLSNYSRHLRTNNPQALEFLPLMDGGIFSSDVKLMKPDAAIYELLCETYQLDPAECLFIDDRQENVDGAIACGMQAIRFDGYVASYDAIMSLLDE